MALTKDALKTLIAPHGFKWEKRPSYRLAGYLVRNEADAWTPARASKDLQELYAWAKKNKFGVHVVEGPLTAIYGNYDFMVPTKFRVSLNKPELTDECFGAGTVGACRACGTINEVGAFTCSNKRCQRRIACSSCQVSGIGLFAVAAARRLGTTWQLCHNCTSVCAEPGCSTKIYTAEYRGYDRATMKCAAHTSSVVCASCRDFEERDSTTVVVINGVEQNICTTCVDQFVCSECNCYKPRGITKLAGKNICKACASVALDKERVKYEKFAKDELPRSGSLLIPSLPERPFRLVSIETEVNGDKDALSGTLYRCGIVRAPEVESYHTQPDNSTKWAAHLKHDGSVTGGELISHCMNLDTQEHADALLTTLTKLHSLKKVGKVSFEENCGGHIHIDAHNFGYGDVWRLITIWNYLEDVIYRLAGAGHEYGHRTLVPGHDRANAGGGYADVPVKGPFGNKGVVGDSIRAQKRMSGLNFVPYINATANCGCRAFAGNGDGRNCTCDLGKATIEWRVWNSQGNPRIIHAWIAFMQAVHAYADQGVDPTPEWEEEFPVHAYTRGPFKNATIKFKQTTKARIEWIFRNLVLTDDERDSLIYAFKQSELKELGNEFLDSLSKLPKPAGVPVVKTPARNPARRTKSIVIEAPKERKAKKTADTTDEAPVAFQHLFAQQFAAANAARGVNW